jgi:hypothetical protein
MMGRYFLLDTQKLGNIFARAGSFRRAKQYRPVLGANIYIGSLLPFKPFFETMSPESLSPNALLALALN